MSNVAVTGPTIVKALSEIVRTHAADSGTVHFLDSDGLLHLYEAMAGAGVAAVIEPAFWIRQPRTNAGSLGATSTCYPSPSKPVFLTSRPAAADCRMCRLDDWSDWRWSQTPIEQPSAASKSGHASAFDSWPASIPNRIVY